MGGGPQTVPRCRSRGSAVRATSCRAAPEAQARRKRRGEDRRSLFLVHFIGITFVSLQKNLAHTLGRRPCEAGYSAGAGGGGRGQPRQEVGAGARGLHWGVGGGGKVCSPRTPHPERSAF